MALSSNLSSRNFQVLFKDWSSSDKRGTHRLHALRMRFQCQHQLFCCSSHCCKMEKGAYKQQTKIQNLHASPINMTAVGFVHGDPERTKKAKGAFP